MIPLTAADFMTWNGLRPTEGQPHPLWELSVFTIDMLMRGSDGLRFSWIETKKSVEQLHGSQWYELVPPQSAFYQEIGPWLLQHLDQAGWRFRRSRRGSLREFVERNWSVSVRFLTFELPMTIELRGDQAAGCVTISGEQFTQEVRDLAKALLREYMRHTVLHPADGQPVSVGLAWWPETP